MQLLVVIAVVAVAAAGLVADRRARHLRADGPTPARRPAPAAEPTAPTSPDPTPWVSLPSAPRPTTADDDWVLEAFAPDEIAELRAIDDTVRRDLAHHAAALVLARVPGGRRGRRVRGIGWSAGRLDLVLADGTSIELDGVPRDTAVWLTYCHDQFGLVLEDLGPQEAAWAARLASCGVDTPLQASRLRVS